MSSRALPWMKFNAKHWQSDMPLHLCSLAARGLWIELVAWMHQAEPYGHLLINGKQPTTRQIATLVGASLPAVVEALAELEENAVFSRTEDGTIYSRRMVRDCETHQEMSQRGTKGARVRYQKTKGKTGSYGTGDGNGNGTGHNQSKEIDISPLGSLADSGPKKLLPSDWSPKPFGTDTQSHRISSLWDEQRLAAELEGFRAHHTTAKSRYADWQQTWSTWVLNTERFDRRSGREPTTATPFADRLAKELEAEERAREATATQT